MEIRDNENFCIIIPLSHKLDKYESQRIINEIEKEPRKIALDMTNVQDCTIDFIENLKSICFNREMNIFNIPSDLFTLFNFMTLDKIAKLYVSELDFEENTRQLINRRFKIV